MADNKKDNRGLASANKKTRERVAKMGGEAHHDKRGPKGSDNK
ncbi:MAG TPA: hypothetical protein VK978_01795 [Candidatus Saccharimonadales bacterium]|nr:hypothetical protein [Candidatus Saccharimonadales bacterium]